MSRWWRKPRYDRIDPPAQPGTTAVERIDHRTFLGATRGRFTAVDFWAAWCAPCRAFAPVFEDVANRNRDRLTFAKCNIDENREVAALLGIQSIPTVVLFGPDGRRSTASQGSSAAVNWNDCWPPPSTRPVPNALGPGSVPRPTASPNESSLRRTEKKAPVAKNEVDGDSNGDHRPP